MSEMVWISDWATVCICINTTIQKIFLTAKVSSSTTYQINLSVCLSVCATLEILILKGSPANQSTVWV